MIGYYTKEASKWALTNLWCVRDAATTYITEVDVVDQLGLSMTATTVLHLGGSNHIVVGIRFQFEHAMQAVSIILQILGQTIEPNQIPNQQHNKELLRFYDQARMGGIALGSSLVIPMSYTAPRLD